MSGQLNAIAREFDFPSTMGISLYCKVVINGTTMTPRISECSWKYLCSLLFSTKSNPGTQETVTIGSIEFDIDLNKAAWMNEWISGTVQSTGQSTSSRFTHFTRGTSTNFVDNGSPLTSRASQVATQTPPQFFIEHSLGYGRECQQGSSQGLLLSVNQSSSHLLYQLRSLSFVSCFECLFRASYCSERR